MRDLTLKEIGSVAGGHCEESDDGSGGSGNTADQQSKDSLRLSVVGLDRPPIDVYERVVDGTSRFIEKVAEAIKGD